MADSQKVLKQEFIDKGITSCEAKLPPMGQYKDYCFRDKFLSMAHRHPRDWYRKKENKDKLWTFEQVAIFCIPCHQKSEGLRKLTEDIFLKIR